MGRRARRPRGRRGPVAREASEAARTRLVPHLVAAFVLFHLAASCVSVFPDLGRGLDRRSWRDPRAQRELAAWADRLGMEQPALEDRAHSIGLRFHEARGSLVAPFAPYARLTGMRQSWAMFAAGTRESDRFGVHAQRCGSDGACAWETLYVHADPEHAWRASILGHPRVRSAIFRWGWPSYAAQYERGCRAILALALADFPDATAARCSFERSMTRSPGDPSPPPPVWGREIVVRR